MRPAGRLVIFNGRSGNGPAGFAGRISRDEGFSVVVKRFHPTFDLNRWIAEFPLEMFEKREGPRHFKPGDEYDLWKARGTWISSPSDLACMEQVRQRTAVEHDLGPAVPVDVFVWEVDEPSLISFPDPPWLTRIGGNPWRPKSRPWPRDREDRPFVFVAQISFVDSLDLFDFQLPGEVLLIFARVDHHQIWDAGSVHIEWSPREIDEPFHYDALPYRALMPLMFQGVIHRTANHPDTDVFDKLGHYQSYYINNLQATTIGTRASIPQGWPFEDGGSTLIAVLSHLSPRERWPFVNLSELPHATMRPHGASRTIDEVFGLGIADAGCLFVYRDSTGRFHTGIEGG